MNHDQGSGSVGSLPFGKIMVILSAEDYAAAESMGRLRYDESQRQRLQGRANCLPNLPQDVRGSAAEIAFARAVGVEADLGVNTYHAPDIAGVQVRSTTLPQGRLIVRPVDSDDDTYVLLTGSYREWIVIGCTKGRQAKQQINWYGGQNGREPCYMVPQQRLQPVTRAALGLT